MGSNDANMRPTHFLKLFACGLLSLGLGACSKPDAPSFAGVNITGAEYARELQLPDAEGRLRSLADFKGKSLDYFTTHAELVRKQAARKAAQKAAVTEKKTVAADGEWSGDSFVQQSDTLARN